MSKTNLKPCPFCGSQRVAIGFDADRYFGLCHQCGARGPHRACRDAGQAAMEWNAPTAARLALLQSLIDEELNTHGGKSSAAGTWLRTRMEEEKARG